LIDFSGSDLTNLSDEFAKEKLGKICALGSPEVFHFISDKIKVFQEQYNIMHASWWMNEFLI